MNKYNIAIILLVIGSLSQVQGYSKLNPGCANPTFQSLAINPADFIGRWYEIYDTKNSKAVMEQNCDCVYTETGQISQNKFSVDNECYRTDLQGRESGNFTAKQVSPGTFEFTFFPEQFFKAPLQVIYLSQDKNVTIGVSCSPYRNSKIFKSMAYDFVWIMAKTPVISEQAKQEAFDVLKQYNFDLLEMAPTVQGTKLCNKFYDGWDQQY